MPTFQAQHYCVRRTFDCGQQFINTVLNTVTSTSNQSQLIAENFSQFILMAQAYIQNYFSTNIILRAEDTVEDFLTSCVVVQRHLSLALRAYYHKRIYMAYEEQC